MSDNISVTFTYNATGDLLSVTRYDNETGEATVESGEEWQEKNAEALLDLVSEETVTKEKPQSKRQPRTLN